MMEYNPPEWIPENEETLPANCSWWDSWTILNMWASKGFWITKPFYEDPSNLEVELFLLPKNWLVI